MYQKGGCLVKQAVVPKVAQTLMGRRSVTQGGYFFLCLNFKHKPIIPITTKQN
jgi:hypothetical protein